MAITAKFLADFEAFKSSVQGAERSLQSLEGQGTKLGTTFDSIHGAASQLAGVFGVAFSAVAIKAFASELIDVADQLTKLHDKTGLSVEGLQRLQVAGDDAGNTIEDIAGAIVRMEDRLAGGDKSAVAAVGRLGLSFDELKRMTPEQQFIAISDAIREIEDPAQQVNLAIDLFGKNGAEVLPTLKRGFDDVRDSVVGMSAETVKALDAAGDASAKFWRAVKANFGEAFADILTLSLSETRRLTSEFQNMIATAEKGAPIVAGMAPPGLPADLDAINKRFDEEAKIINDRMTPAAIAFRNAMDSLSLTGEGWRTVLDTIDGSVVEAIKHYLAAGVSQQDLAAAYGLTATQIRAVAAAMKDEAAAADFAATAKARQIEITRQMTAATNAQVIAQLALNQANEAFLANALAEAQAADASFMNQPAGISPFIHGNQRGPAINSTGQVPFSQLGPAPLNTGAGTGGSFSLGNFSLRAGGGPVTSGQSYVVGERGPELFTPGASGFVTPSGGGANITIYVNGTAEDVARKIADKIMRTVKSGTKVGLS